jgi:alkanesulfonate monooxygenase SsuD/methylene tetrahydromethanopterin reductase-like flavin-dependent oxidoreductase (luciferase family)
MGIVLRDPLPWPHLREIAETVEETGYQAIFVPEISGREAFSTLAGLASATSRQRLGTGVVTMWARGPVATAMAAATVQDLSGGRMILGIGAGSPPGPAAARAVRDLGPVELVRRFSAIVRSVLSGEATNGEEPFEVAEFRLALPAAAGPPPVWLAALGDRMLALAGEVADGVIMNWCTPERVREARELLDRAARAAGRVPGDVTLSVYVRACLGMEEAALPPLREMTGQYAGIPHYRRQMERMGLGREAAAAVQAMSAGRPQDVPEDLVRSLTVTGGRTEALARFDAYRRAGADLILCYPVATRDPFSSVLGTVLAAAPSPAVER